MYVANGYKDNTVTVIDTKTNTVVSTITVGNVPDRVTIARYITDK